MAATPRLPGASWRRGVVRRVVLPARARSGPGCRRTSRSCRSAGSWHQRGDESAGLVEGLAVFLLGIGIRYDAAADLEVHVAAEHETCADHDARIYGAREREIPDGAAVGGALGRLELRDALHRANLGRTGDRAAGA